MEFKNTIETDDCSMAGGTTYYSLEDIYLAFKERYDGEMIKEIADLKAQLEFERSTLRGY